MSGLFIGILCITKRGFQYRSLNSPTPNSGSYSIATNYENHHGSTSSMIEQTSVRSRVYKVEQLGQEAREAKERLDRKLRRTKSKEARVKYVGNGKVESSSTTLQKNAEMFGMKKNGIKKISRKEPSSSEDGCMICLESFKDGDNLMHLQCDHKFHSCCLVPWFENYSYCPFCRMEIVSSINI